MVITRYLYKPTAGEGLTRFNDNRRLHIFVVDVGTQQVTQLTDGADYEHSIDWSPTGDEILFVSNREAESPTASSTTTSSPCRRARGRRGASPRPRARSTRRRGRPTARARVRGHEARPDLVGNDDGGHARVGDERRRHGPRASSAPAIDNRQGAPRWSGDGRHVYFTLQDRGNVKLMRLPAAGGAAETRRRRARQPWARGRTARDTAGLRVHARPTRRPTSTPKRGAAAPVRRTVAQRELLAGGRSPRSRRSRSELSTAPRSKRS